MKRVDMPQFCYTSWNQDNRREWVSIFWVPDENSGCPERAFSARLYCQNPSRLRARMTDWQFNNPLCGMLTRIEIRNEQAEQ